jgi:hypothetical protein
MKETNLYSEFKQMAAHPTPSQLESELVGISFRIESDELRKIDWLAKRLEVPRQAVLYRLLDHGVQDALTGYFMGLNVPDEEKKKLVEEAFGPRSAEFRSLLSEEN